MRLLDFFKKLTEEKKEAKSLTINQLKDWIETLSKKSVEDTHKKSADTREQIQNEREKLKENIEILKTAKLRNPHIPERAKKFMEGNRAEFIQRAENLLEKSKPSEDLLKTFQHAMEQMAKGSQRRQAILSEFFANETNAIARNAMTLNKLINTMKELEEDKPDSLKNDIKEFEDKIKLEDSLKKDIEKAKEELTKNNKLLEEKEKELKKAEEGEEHKKHLTLKKQKETLEKEVKNKSEVQTSLFSIPTTTEKVRIIVTKLAGADFNDLYQK